MTRDHRIDKLADQFESVWNSGQRISADAFLAQFAGEETIWQELLDEFRVVEQELQRKYPTAEANSLGEHKRIGNYELLERIGSGGMGEVYRARHVLLNKIVAVKVLPDAFAEDELAVKRFERELKLIGSMSHPNIVQALGAEQTEGKMLLVMEFIKGINLQQFIAYGKKMPVVEALAVVRQVAAGLQHAHEQKIIHRDIKPANIMLTTAGTAKILDFGLGKFYDEMLLSERGDSSGPLTKMGSPLGTVDFLSPEQWDNPGNVDIRSDIYSLGCTFYTIVLGEVPYPSGRFGSIPSKMAAHIGHSPPSLLAGGIAASPEIEAILQKMCAKDPSQRFATPQELLEAIDEYQSTDVREHRAEQKRREQYKQLGEEIIKASTAEDWQTLARQFREMDGYRNTADLAEKCDARYRKLKERREKQERQEQYGRRAEQYGRRAEGVKTASSADDWRNLTGQVLTMAGSKTTDELAKEYHERFRILKEHREKQGQGE